MFGGLFVLPQLPLVATLGLGPHPGAFRNTSSASRIIWLERELTPAGQISRPDQARQSPWRAFLVWRFAAGTRFSLRALPVRSGQQPYSKRQVAGWVAVSGRTRRRPQINAGGFLRSPVQKLGGYYYG